jgi:hypothetical protein
VGQTKAGVQEHTVGIECDAYLEINQTHRLLELN